ncbi:mitochondrial outer membrane protein porin 2-like [Nymphaea colorata]|nr:mitochondrial outer membrane protein porin 2-like [Nymphaea colorata]
MTKGPGLFGDIGKKAKDLLTKDYSYDQKFTFSTHSAVGLGLTSTAVKKGGISSGEIATVYKYENGIIDVKVDTESNICTTITVSEILPSTKTIASFKLPDYNSGKIELQYFHDHATLSTAVGLNPSPLIDLSATFGTKNFAVGAETGFDTTAGTFTKYNAGISITKPDSCASIILADKGDVLKVAYVQSIDQLKRTSTVAEISRKFSTNQNTFTVGASHAIDPLTLVKARLNNHGKLGALLQHQLKSASVLTLSGEFDTKSLEKKPKFGLALALNP